MDLGNYERMMYLSLARHADCTRFPVRLVAIFSLRRSHKPSSRGNNLTTGKIYESVIKKDRICTRIFCDRERERKREKCVTSHVRRSRNVKENTWARQYKSFLILLVRLLNGSIVAWQHFMLFNLGSTFVLLMAFLFLPRIFLSQ